MTSPGEVLNGRYRLEKRLGEGAMGSVWRAYDPVLERLVAVKELITNRSGGEPLEIRLERVRREALALAKIEHPAIVTIHDLIYVRSAEDPWIVMGYAHGRSLDKIIVADGRLGEQQVAAIGLAVFEGLEACHKHRVYHRDVKPANIVVGEDGSARLVDFGIVRMVGKEALTATSNVLGTPEFLAPEMVDKQPKVGPTTDMWALAVTLYCALEGKSPFWAESINAIFAAIAAKSPPEPRDGGPLAELVVQMLRKQPRDRPDAATVKSVLRDIAGLDSPRGGPSPREQNRTADRNGWAGHVPPQPSAGYRQETQLVHTEHRRAPLNGLPLVNAAKEIARLPTEQAVVRLLALGEPDAANIINRCDDPDAGRLLSAIATDDRVRARKILEMVTINRAGQLLDDMSSIAAAAVLALKPTDGAVRIMVRCDDQTIVEALSEMDPDRAAEVVLTMGEGRAVAVLRQAAPLKVARVVRYIAPHDRRQVLLNQLPERFRAAVTRLL